MQVCVEDRGTTKMKVRSTHAAGVRLAVRRQFRKYTGMKKAGLVSRADMAEKCLWMHRKMQSWQKHRQIIRCMMNLTHQNFMMSGIPSAYHLPRKWVRQGMAGWHWSEKDPSAISMSFRWWLNAGRHLTLMPKWKWNLIRSTISRWLDWQIFTMISTGHSLSLRGMRKMAAWSKWQSAIVADIVRSFATMRFRYRMMLNLYGFAQK